MEIMKHTPSMTTICACICMYQYVKILIHFLRFHLHFKLPLFCYTFWFFVFDFDIAFNASFSKSTPYKYVFGISFTCVCFYAKVVLRFLHIVLPYCLNIFINKEFFSITSTWTDLITQQRSKCGSTDMRIY